MYATVSYDVNAGKKPIEDLRTAMFDLFKGHKTCDLLADTFICKVSKTDDYLDIVRALKTLGDDFEDQFQFVITLHSAGDPLKSNASFSKSKADAITD